jgi:hypothetical protein
MSSPAPATCPLPAPRTLRRRSSRAQLRLVLVEVTTDADLLREDLTTRRATATGPLAACLDLLLASLEAQS